MSKTMNKLPIFMYHHVSEDIYPSLKKMRVSPVEFEQQMRFMFQKGYHCLSISEVVANWQQCKPQPEHSFVLTFDDGYIDFYENASPILKAFGFTAIVFVVVNWLEDSNKKYLSWQGMRELAKNQCVFGSHTLNHQRLCNLDNRTILRELDDSKKIIEDRLGLPVELLAYPYGDSNERIQDMARKVGYRAACGVTVGNHKQFNLWRVPIVGSESYLSFYWKAHGGYYMYNWLKEKTPIGYIGRKIRKLIQGTQDLPIV